jgi:glutamine amidotransferase
MSHSTIDHAPRAAIVDYGLGNLFSVRYACAHAGIEGFITSSSQDIVDAAAVILPGVGAFKDAMTALRDLDLVSPLRDVAASGKPLFGVCLGMQLLMTESHEFGCHRGLDLLSGSVVRLTEGQHNGRPLKVPHIGWSPIHPLSDSTWDGSPLATLQAGTFMYFVHSYHVVPVERACQLSVTRYGDIDMCSSLQRENIFACQFHPERSGPAGLRMYQNLASRLRSSLEDSWTRE